jgi:hypothetical protein
MPLLINGDDILFQSTHEFAGAWMEVVGRVGLEVERTKTSVSLEFGSLNSTLVRVVGKSCRVVPTLRFGMLRSMDYPHSLPSSFRDFVHGVPRKGNLRWRAAREWFSWHRSEFKQSLSLTEIGFTGSLAFRSASREGVLHFQKSRIESGVPLRSTLPPAPTLHNVVLSGDNVIKVASLNAEEEEVFGKELVSWKWSMRRRFSLKDARINYVVALQNAIGYVDPLSHPSTHRALVKDQWPRYQDQPWGWRDVYAREYRARKPDVLKACLFFDYLDRLPVYGEDVGAFVDGTPVDLRHSYGFLRDPKTDKMLVRSAEPSGSGIYLPDSAWTEVDSWFGGC